MFSQDEIRAIRRFCSKDPMGLIFAYGIIGEHGYYKARIDGKSVVPFWSKREDAERVLKSKVDMSGYEISVLDAIFLVANQFPEIDSQGDFVGINWPEDPKGWWGKPVPDVERQIRIEMVWTDEAKEPPV